jgi:hypothetical protein
MEREGWTFRKYDDLDEMKADQYRYWQSGPASGIPFLAGYETKNRLD